MQEANTMAERDLGSTFLLPHTHLYKPDRVSMVKNVSDLVTTQNYYTTENKTIAIW